MNDKLSIAAVALGVLCAGCSSTYAPVDGRTSAQAAPYAAPAAPQFRPLGDDRFPLSEAVQVGDILYLSGQLGLAKDGSGIVSGGIEPETRRTMDRIGETLAEYDLTHDALFKCTVWLADMSDFGAFNAVYKTYFDPSRYPARSAMAVKGLAAGALVEVECMAWNP